MELYLLYDGGSVQILIMMLVIQIGPFLVQSVLFYLNPAILIPAQAMMLGRAPDDPVRPGLSAAADQHDARGDDLYRPPGRCIPGIADEMENLIPFHSQRGVIRPGMFGWAPVNLPSSAAVDPAIELSDDLYYSKYTDAALNFLEITARPVPCCGDR